MLYVLWIAGSSPVRDKKASKASIVSWPLFIKPLEYLNRQIHSLHDSKDSDNVLLHFKHIFRGIHNKKTVLRLCFSQNIACSIVIVRPSRRKVDNNNGKFHIRIYQRA